MEGDSDYLFTQYLVYLSGFLQCELLYNVRPLFFHIQHECIEGLFYMAVGTGVIIVIIIIVVVVVAATAVAVAAAVAIITTSAVASNDGSCAVVIATGRVIIGAVAITRVTRPKHRVRSVIVTSIMIHVTNSIVI